MCNYYQSIDFLFFFFFFRSLSSSQLNRPWHVRFLWIRLLSLNSVADIIDYNNSMIMPVATVRVWRAILVDLDSYVHKNSLATLLDRISRSFSHFAMYDIGILYVHYECCTCIVDVLVYEWYAYRTIYSYRLYEYSRHPPFHSNEIITWIRQIKTYRYDFFFFFFFYYRLRILNRRLARKVNETLRVARWSARIFK